MVLSNKLLKSVLFVKAEIAEKMAAVITLNYVVLNTKKVTNSSSAADTVLLYNYWISFISQGFPHTNSCDCSIQNVNKCVLTLHQSA